MFVQQLGFIELAIIHRSTYNRSVCNSSSTAWRWYSYQQLSSFKVNAKYSTKKFKGVKKVFIISPHSPQEKDNNGEDWPKTIGKGRRLRSHNSGLVFCSKHLLNLYGIQNSLFSNDWLAYLVHLVLNCRPFHCLLPFLEVPYMCVRIPCIALDICGHSQSLLSCLPWLGLS